jgi:hypothetical protein
MDNGTAVLAADGESKLYYVMPEGGFGNGEWRM